MTHPRVTPERLHQPSKNFPCEGLATHFFTIRSLTEGVTAAVPASEFRSRLARVRDRLAGTDADAAVWFGATATVDGYYSELERTMFVGAVDDENEHYFELMYEAQETAFEAMGPGVPVSHVDEAGYRHSDTVVVTDDGIEFLTYFPRDLESNVVG